jgi:hypothetical protein
MIAAAGGAAGQTKHLRQRNKCVHIGFNAGWDELTSTRTSEHDLEHRMFSLLLPPQ